ncbi:MAG: hypothetical protein WBA57_19895 [Elainellaceae cyanobacterium]
MIALKDLWKQQRQQRQQEVLQRQQEVHHSLAQMQQERLASAAQLNLELKQFQLQLQQQTQKYLFHLSVERKQRAEILVISLREFASALQEQTQQFLSLTHADRQLKAEELFRSLSLFHAELITSVDALRHNLQVEIKNLRDEVQAIRADTQNYLTEVHQKRILDQIKLAESLAAYVKTLSSQVNTYLAELNQMDQLRAQAIQEEFKQQQQARQAEMQALFEDLGVFRGELKTYCADLKTMVWGDGAGQSAAPTANQVGVNYPKLQPRSTDNSSVPENGVSQRSSIPVASKTQSATATKAVVLPQAPPVVQPPVAAPAALPEPPTQSLDESGVSEPPPALATPDTSIDTFAESVNDSLVNRTATPMTWGTASVAPARKDVKSIENEIFEFLKTSGGARLTELETGLNINRFQAVDTLRSLIKQGKVTQRDRVYITQEEGTL